MEYLDYSDNLEWFMINSKILNLSYQTWTWNTNIKFLPYTDNDRKTTKK